ncbi:(2Fe-2S)-binding protein [Paenibacillus pinistramenti]|uniref:(2Fe-2S)-binding protein n=1 Tax=Paenibacillus pinistramenti TaxID=1768003 RepID=UPI0011094C6D|nr:(2Fe-2S)-binding protein [Paenibacillus pinistramenti]
MEPYFDFTFAKMYYHVSPEGAGQPLYEQPAVRMFEDQPLREMLSSYGQQVQALSLELPASFVGTSLCRLTLIQLLFAAQYDRLIDLQPDNLVYQVEKPGDYAYFGYKIKEVRSDEIPAGERSSYLARHWERYFGMFITPAIEKIAGAAGLKPDAIWQQFGGQLNFVIDFLAANEPRQEVVERFMQDSRQLKEMAPELFRRRRNPYHHPPRYVESPLNPGEKWLIQSSCCMYDRRAGGSRCYTCPQLTPAEREVRRQAMLAEAGK